MDAFIIIKCNCTKLCKRGDDFFLVHNMFVPTTALAVYEGGARREARRLAAVLMSIAAALPAIEAASVSTNAPYHLTGHQWFLELLISPNPHHIKEVLGIHRHVFLSLVARLSDMTDLMDNRNVSIFEQVAIFLYTVTGNVPRRLVARRFQRSTQTIAECVDALIDALASPAFYSKYVSLPDSVPPDVENNPKFFPYFKDVVATLNIIQFNNTPRSEDQMHLQNRISQNVLFSSTFDMRFCHVLRSWEERSVEEITFRDLGGADLCTPPGKCYLAGPGFPSSEALLVPYQDARCQLKEWDEAELRYVVEFSRKLVY